MSILLLLSCTTAVDNGAGADVPTEYGRKISCWSSGEAIHPLLESGGFLAHLSKKRLFPYAHVPQSIQRETQERSKRQQAKEDSAAPIWLPHATPAFQKSLPAPTVSPRYEGDEKQDCKHDDPDRSNTERDNG